MTGKTTNKPNSLKAGSHLQTFLDSDGKHHIDTMREVTYREMLLAGGRRHSEFMMPFMNEDYPGMDYLWPDLDLFGDLPGVNDALTAKSGGTAGAAYKFTCIISCQASVIGSQCDGIDPLRCYYGAVTGEGNIGNWGVSESPADFSGVGFEEGNGGAPVHGIPTRNWDQLSSETGYWITVQYSDAGGVGGWYYHPLLDRWIYIEGGFSTCYYEVFINCPACPPEVVMTFNDDDTPDTIDPNDSIGVFVQDGLGPYTWTTSSTGYSLADAETSGLANTLSCVDGDCDVDFDPVATVNVTDICGDTTSFNIRNTAGQWTTIGQAAWLPSNCIGGAGCTPADTQYIYGGDNISRWFLTAPKCYRDLGGPCTATWYTPAPAGEAPPVSPSEAASDHTCASPNSCFWTNSSVADWQCTP